MRATHFSYYAPSLLCSAVQCTNDYIAQSTGRACYGLIDAYYYCLVLLVVLRQAATVAAAAAAGTRIGDRRSPCYLARHHPSTTQSRHGPLRSPRAAAALQGEGSAGCESQSQGEVTRASPKQVKLATYLPRLLLAPNGRLPAVDGLCYKRAHQGGPQHCLAHREPTRTGSWDIMES